MNCINANPRLMIKGGYPYIATGPLYKIMYLKEFISIDGFHIHHTCKNKKCVNILHLISIPASLHSKITNTGLRRTHCRKGHLKSKDNLYNSTSILKNGKRSQRCRICTLKNKRASYHRCKRLIRGSKSI